MSGRIDLSYFFYTDLSGENFPEELVWFLKQSIAGQKYRSKVTSTIHWVHGTHCRLNNYKEDKQTLINAIADTLKSEPNANSKYICLIL